MSKDNLTDEEYFRLMMQSVTPLHKHRHKHTTHHTYKSESTLQLNTYVQYIDSVSAEDLIVYYKNPLATNQRKKLIHGQLQIEARLDLHGLNTDDACSALTQFIQRSLRHHQCGFDHQSDQPTLCGRMHTSNGYRGQAAGRSGLSGGQGHKRCVLIIHGKGGKNHESPVLKNHLNNWLKQIPQVLAFHSAQPRHGGTGAVYVLLSS